MSKYTYVDARPSTAHLNTLLGAGWSRRAIAATTNGILSDVAVSLIAAGRNTRVRDITETAILTIDPHTLPTSSFGRTEPFVPKHGAIRRLQALLAIGWTHEHMSEHCGFQTGAFMHKTTAGLCLLSTHNKIAAMYRHLATRPGPSELTRQRAARLGYASPAAWDDIDNDYAPDHLEDNSTEDTIDEVVIIRILAGDKVTTTAAERREIVRRWPETGKSLNELARLTGWKPERYTTTEEDAA